MATESHNDQLYTYHLDELDTHPAGQKRSNSYIMEDTNYTMELAENSEDENFETKRFKSTKETSISSAQEFDVYSPLSTLSIGSSSNLEEESPILSPCIEDWLSTFTGWTNEYKAQALNKLVKLCDSSQLKSLMENIRPRFQRDFISLLPRELALHVLSFLTPRDLLVAAQTCRTWRVLCDDIVLWREKCQQCVINDTLYGVTPRRRPALIYNPWKQMFLTKHRIEWNWRNVELKLPPRLKVLKGHDDHVVTCLQFHGNRIVSGSDDTTMKIWSAVTGRCLRTLQGHTGGVWCSEFDGQTIVSGSTDRTLRLLKLVHANKNKLCTRAGMKVGKQPLKLHQQVWNTDTGQCRHVLQGHSSTVRCVAMFNKTVVSGSRDATLRVWDVETGECTNVLQGHVAAVRCVQFDGTYVVSGAYDFLVKVWDPIEGTCQHTLQGHTNRVYSLLFDGVHVVSGSLDTSIRVWDVKSGQCIHTLVGHQSLTSAMELKGNILVSGNADSTVKVWDVTKGYCLHTLHGRNKHQSAVTSLQFTEHFVVTSSDDGSVKLWDIKTGAFIRDLVFLDGGGNGGVVWRVKCNERKLVCAVGSRNGIEDTKLLVLDFDCQTN